MNTVHRLFETEKLDFAAVVTELREAGATTPVAFLAEDFRRELHEAAGRAPYRRAREVVGRGDRVVRQDMEVSSEFPPDSPFHRLRLRFEALLAGSAAALGEPPFATPLHLDSMMLQRYRAGSSGITPHLDALKYVNIVCLFTLSGRAVFGTCADRSGAGAHEYDAFPGSLVLMRAPGFLGAGERPFHFVREVREERYSFGLRQLRPGADGP